ncbi:hypothetical protein ACHAXR_006994 [Thalassiosira sp. AJA248-18]
MKKQSKKTSRQNPAIIKGYLPIRIALPPVGNNNNNKGSKKKNEQHSSFTSFIYIKEHIQKGDNSGIGGATTLFIVNAPANGPIRTDIFLRALFESYGDIQRVTVARDPRKVGVVSFGDEAAVETFREAAIMGLDDDGGGGSAALFEQQTATTTRRGDGKFAHVVFTSGKEMKKALKLLKREMSEAADGMFEIRLDGDRMEQLKLETMQLLSSKKNNDDSDDESQDQDDEEEEEEDKPLLTGIHAIAAQARQKAGRNISRQQLMQLCNDAMASFETKEAEAERQAKLAAEQPDEDGFITVTHGSTPSFGATNDLEEDHYHRRKAGKRNRKRKVGVLSGADELSDFYRFQLKERRRGEVQDLKKRFEEDLKKVKKMKEERAYRPF